RGHALAPEMSGHLLVLECLARGLPLAGRAVATMRDRHTMAGPQSTEIMPLHRTGKTLTDADAHHVYMLARDKMRCTDLRAALEQGVVGDTNLGEPRLRFDFRPGKMAALRLRDVLGLGGADAELHRRVTIGRVGAHGDDLAAVDLEHR